MNPEPETYTTTQAAARTGLTSAAIRDLSEAGQLTHRPQNPAPKPHTAVDDEINATISQEHHEDDL